MLWDNAERQRSLTMEVLTEDMERDEHTVIGGLSHGLNEASRETTMGGLSYTAVQEERSTFCC